MQIEQAISEFLADLELAGRRPLTRTKHREYLMRLADWLVGAGHDWQRLTAQQLQVHVRCYARHAASTKSNAFCALRMFYAWSVGAGYVAMSPAARLRTVQRPRCVPKALALEQIRTLLVALNGARSRTQARDRALILTGLYAGLRASELAQLRWSDIDLADRVITISISKMNKGRSVPLHPALGAELDSWRRRQALAGNPPAFSLDGRSINGNRAGKIVREWARPLGLPLTTHVLRHSFATHVLRRSRDLYAVSGALGHEELKQTEIYVSADPAQLRAAVEVLPAIDAW